MALVAALFPGQGSQRVGMGASLLKDFPAARLIFEEAEDSLSLPLRKLCLEGPADKLELTENQQPCILTLSLAIWQVLKQESQLAPSWFAGHSLGEYSALVAAGKIPLPQAVKLVHLRGKAMQAAVPAGQGAMAAVLGYDELKLTAMCQQVAKTLKACVEVVNFNSPAQQIISGHKHAVTSVCEALAQEKIKTMLLPVSAPFHSSLMAPAKEAMRPYLSVLSFSTPSGRVIANLSGKLEADYHADLLIRQIDSPVLWRQSMQSLEELGADSFIEVGPGRVLAGLAKRCLKGTGKILQTEDLPATIRELHQLD